MPYENFMNKSQVIFIRRPYMYMYVSIKIGCMAMPLLISWCSFINKLLVDLYISKLIFPIGVWNDA